METIFKSKKAMPFLALFCALLWSLAFPFIKLGYGAAGIQGDDLGSKVLYAGIRFFCAGILVLLADLVKGRKKKSGTSPSKPMDAAAWRWILLFSLVNISLHYMCSYIGLSYIPSSRGSVLNSMGTFFLIILSTLLFKDDRFSVNKAAGCLLGLASILMINIHPGQAFFAQTSFMGDGMILLNALFGALGSIIGRLTAKRADMTQATGISMTLGGVFLAAAGLIIRPKGAWTVSVSSVLILTVLTLISAVAFTIYNSLVVYHPISKVAIFNAFIPVFGVCFSSLLLKEPFLWTYLAAGLLAALGTRLINQNPLHGNDPLRRGRKETSDNNQKE